MITDSCIDYSVVIRTTGKAGEKYQALLDSIAQLEPQPREVIVVLPEGYDKPKEQLGSETFYFCPKGMVIQRMTGIEKCQTPYALVCDDDVCFSSDFVQKLHQPIAEGLCGISAGPLYSFLPEKGVKALFSAVSGAAVPTVLRKDHYVSVLRTTGYSYNRHLNLQKRRYYGAQSLAWTCFFASTEALRAISLSDETWLDAHGYSAYDDQTMFYKAHLRGIKTIVVADAFYEHKDAKTSTQNNKPAVLYSLIMNRIIFWHRFIYSVLPMKWWSRVGFGYRCMWIDLWNWMDSLRGRYGAEERAILKQAKRDARAYIRSKEYRDLPPVR